MIWTRIFQIILLSKFCVVWYDLNLRPRNFVQAHCTPVTQRHSVVEVWFRLGQVKRRYALDKWSQKRQMNGRIDRLITIGHLQSRGPNNFLFVRVHLNIQQLYIMISSLTDIWRNIFLTFLLLSYVTIRESYILFATKNHYSNISCWYFICLTKTTRKN